MAKDTLDSFCVFPVDDFRCEEGHKLIVRHFVDEDVVLSPRFHVHSRETMGGNATR